MGWVHSAIGFVANLAANILILWLALRLLESLGWAQVYIIFVETTP